MLKAKHDNGGLRCECGNYILNGAEWGNGDGKPIREWIYCANSQCLHYMKKFTPPTFLLDELPD
jgi:hypothetical protein